MATQTWSWKLSGDPSSEHAGTTWTNTYTLSGSALPSNAIISKVEYSLTARLGTYSSSSGYFRLYGIAVQNGAYTGAAYTASSAPSSSKDIDADTSVNTSNTSRPSSSSDYNSYSFESGTAYVWRYNNARTYCELANCDFNNISTTSAFFNSSFKVRLKFNCSLSGTTYITAISVKVTYSLPSFTAAPKITSIVQNDDGTFTINWDKATWSGTGTIYYYVNAGSSSYSGVTGNKDTQSIPKYGESITFFVRASVDGVSIDSENYTKTFSLPTLSTPSISINPSSGQSTVVTRGNSSLSNTKGDITYTLKYNGKSAGQFSGTTFNVTEAKMTEWGGTSFTFTVTATATNLTNKANGEILTKTSSDVTFTFEPHKTILYYTGSGSIENGYAECTIWYYTGYSTKGDNGWVECEPYYYTGDTSIGDNGWQLCSYT